MSKLPKYRITIDPDYSMGEDLGISQIAFTSNPAIKVKGMAFKAAIKETKQFFADEVKMRIAAPALIPMEIYRNDEDGEYFVEFTVEEIESIHSKFMLNLNNQGKFNLEHNDKNTVPAYVLETWIVDNPKEDKAFSTFGIEVPKGTLMVVSQLTDKTYYQSLVENNQIGYSIEGFLGLKLSDIIIAEELIKIKNKENTMILPEGTKFTADNKNYIVLAGVITEDKTELAVETPVEKVKPVEPAVETPVKPVEPVAIDEAAILAIIQPKLDELYKIIADLKVTDIAEDVKPEDTTPMDTKMNIHDKFSYLQKIIKE